MPSLTLNTKRLTTKAKFQKILLALRSFSVGGLLVFSLSGCSAVGSNKPAALQITSVPEASVFLDGKHLGKTPFFSDQLKSGEYTLKITVSEASYVEKITLTPGTLTVVNRELANNFLAGSGESLWLTSGKKGIFVSSMPAEADLTVDGRLVGKTPILIEEIEDGEHKVTLEKKDYIQREFSVKTQNKYQLVADVTLASEIAKDLKASQAETPTAPKVEILKTSLGFLRVRKEPALNAVEIGRVTAGQQLEVIQEIKDWIQVKFEDPPGSGASKQGWISSQYTKKLE